MRNNNARVREDHMQHLDEGTIHAWLDGALSADAAARAETHVASCALCAEAVAEARGFIAASSRILTALDDVPNVRSAGADRAAKSAQWGRRSVATWLVRERMAAVVALVVAGGALALVMTRSGDEATQVQVALEAAPAAELVVADSPPPPAVPQARPSLPAVVGTGGATASSSRETPVRDLTATRQADTAPLALAEAKAPEVASNLASAPQVRTDDTLRSVEIAAAERAESQERSAEARSSLTEKLADALPRRRAASDAAARFAEPAPPTASIGRASGAAGLVEPPRLVQEERMTEDGRDVRRRIYSVDGILVTLDERQPGVREEEARLRVQNAAPAAPAQAPSADSAAHVTHTIRWTDARGAELTLSGPAPAERLERIRKLLGY
jgi:hypothetical protein